MTRILFSFLVVWLLATCLSVTVAGSSVVHEPISIRCNADLLSSSAVVGGSGSRKDPYIIGGWSIHAVAGAGIDIKGVSAYVIIRDCEITGSGSTAIGILISKASHVQVTNCRLTSLASGIFIYQAPTVIVDGNTIESCRRGIEGTESEGITIAGSLINESKDCGIFLWRCHHASLIDNREMDCRNGIYLDSCHYDNLQRNHEENVDHGIFLWDCFDCRVLTNVLAKCGLGLAVVHTSERNVVFHNSFLDNDSDATCDEAGNSWDGGYPAGGNFWEENPVTDLFSGEGQDLSGPDGICDTPRDVPFNCVDPYPLAEQPAVKE